MSNEKVIELVRANPNFLFFSLIPYDFEVRVEAFSQTAVQKVRVNAELRKVFQVMDIKSIVDLLVSNLRPRLFYLQLRAELWSHSSCP